MEPFTTLLQEIDADLDRAVETAIKKLEVEKQRLTRPLDEKIEQLRARLRQARSSSETLPNATKLVRSRPAPTQTGRHLPRGKTQRTTYLYIEAHPGIGYRELVEGIDGRYTENAYNKYRNVLRALKDGQWVKGDPGAWETLKGASDDEDDIKNHESEGTMERSV